MGIEKVGHFIGGVADNVFNPEFDSIKQTDDNKLNNVEKEIQESTSYYEKRGIQEKLQDSINIINSNVERDTDFFSKFPEYKERLEKLNYLSDLNKIGLHYTQKNLGFIQKYITAPMYDVLVDIGLPTDLGDTLSVARTGLAVTSAGVGNALAKGGTAIAGKIGGIITAELGVSAFDTAIDIGRYYDEIGEKPTTGQIAGMYGLNVAGGLAMNGLLGGVSWGAKTLKDKITNVGAKALASQEPNIITPSTVKNNTNIVVEEFIPTNTVSGAVEKMAVKQVGEEGATQIKFMYDVGTVGNNPYSVSNKMSFQDGTGISSGIEKQAMAEILSETKDEVLKYEIEQTFKNKNVTLNMTDDYLKLMKETPELHTDNIIAELWGKVKNIKEKAIYDEITNTAHYMRDAVTTAQEVSLKTGKNVSELLDKTAFEKAIIIDKRFEESKLKQMQNFNDNLYKIAGDYQIGDMADLIQNANDNNIDLMYHFLTGKPYPNEIPKEIQKAYDYTKDMFYKYNLKLKQTAEFSEDDIVVAWAKNKGLIDTLMKADVDNDGLKTIYKFNSELTGKKANEIINTIRSNFKEEIENKINSNQINIPSEYSIAFESLKDNLFLTDKELLSKMKNMGLTPPQRRETRKIINSIRESLGVDTTPLEMISEIKKEFAKRNSIKNRMFEFINKRDVMTEIGDVTQLYSVVDGIQTDTKIYVDENIFRSKATPEQINKLDKILNICEKYDIGKNRDPLTDLNAYGLSIPLSDGRSKVIDLTKTSINDLEKLYSTKNKNWEKLNKVKKFDYIAYDIQMLQDEKVGKIVARKLGYDLKNPETGFVTNKFTMGNVGDVAKSYLEKWGIKDVDITFEFDSKKPQFYYAPNEKKIMMSIPKNMSDKPYTVLGILRHELQHLYDDKVLGKLEDEVYRTAFRNKPTIVESDIFKRIEDGENVSVMEVMMKYYDNHFYSTINDNFEMSYQGFQARKIFNDMTTYDKLTQMQKMLKATRTSTTKDRIHIQELFGFTDDMPKQIIMSSDELENFFIKSFDSLDNMYKFLAEVANLNNNTSKINTLTNAHSKIIANMGAEDIGFSKNDVLAKLNTTNYQKLFSNLYSGEELIQFDNQHFREGMGKIRDYLREKWKGNTLRTSNPTDAKTLASSLVSDILIGSREISNYIYGPALQACSYILNGGNFSQATKLLVKGYGQATSMFVKAFPSFAGSLIENPTLLLDATVSSITKNTKQKSRIAMLALKTADKLHKAGDIKGSGVSLYEFRKLQEFQTKMAILKSGEDPYKFTSKLAMKINKSMVSAYGDDIIGTNLAKGATLSEFRNMLKSNNFEQLNPIQQRMYRHSGFTKDKFIDFKNALNEAITKHGDDFYKSTNRFNDMVNAGLILNNAIEEGKHLIKHETPFLYMARTIYNATLTSMNKMRMQNINGFQMPTGSGLHTLNKVLSIAGLSALGMTLTVPHEYAKRYLLGSKTFLDDGRKALDDFKKDPKKGISKLTSWFINEAINFTPLGYIGNPANTTGLLGAGASLINRNIFDFKKMEFKDGSRMAALAFSTIFGARALYLYNAYEKANDISENTGISKNKIFKELIMKPGNSGSKNQIKSLKNILKGKANSRDIKKLISLKLNNNSFEDDFIRVGENIYRDFKNIYDENNRYFYS